MGTLNTSELLGVLGAGCAIGLIAIPLRRSAADNGPRYRIHGSDIDHLEIDPDPDQLTQARRPRPYVMLSIKSCQIIGDHLLRLDFKVRNFGATTSLKKWQALLVKNGRPYLASVHSDFHRKLKDGLQQEGFAVVDAPKLVFKSKRDLVLNLGYTDSENRWRWSAYSGS